jgi:hypothetical protein
VSRVLIVSDDNLIQKTSAASVVPAAIVVAAGLAAAGCTQRYRASHRQYADPSL